QAGTAAGAQRCFQTAIALVPEPRLETESSSAGSTSSPSRALPAATSTKRGAAPAPRPAASRSSPSVANSPSRSRCLRSRSLRTSFSFSLWGLSIIGFRCGSRGVCLLLAGFFSWNEKAGLSGGPPGKVECWLRLGGRTLPGKLHKSAEGVAVADRDLGE